MKDGLSHRELHPAGDVPDCFACKVTSINIGSGALPNRRREAARLTFRDRRMAEDHDAYRRLRKQGIQPAGLDNCAQMEAGARTRYEIEAGVCMPANVPTRKLRALVNQGVEISEANNIKPGVKYED